jgi:glycosyltransferase involved in cell wall biosynthesis
MGDATLNLRGFVSRVKPVETINMELNHLVKEKNSTPVPDQFTLTQPLVSVIVPAYNAETYIAHTLNSVISQTYKNIEVIVVDDGSNDGTAQIVESIIQRDDRVILLRQSNSGVAAARNLAIQKSRGEYIASIDADDIWYPQKIEKQVHCMLHADPNIGLVYAWSVHIDERGLLTGGYNASHIEGDAFGALIVTNFISNSSSPLIRRVCFEKVGGYSTRLFKLNAQGCEDRDLYLRIAESYKFRVVKEFLIGYRRINSSMSLNYKSMEKSNGVVIGEVKQRYPNIPSFVYRWSKSHYYLYLSDQSRSCAHYWTSILYLYKAARMDLVFLLYTDFYRTLLSNVLRLVKQAVIFTIRVVHCPSAGIFEMASPNRKEITISDIVIRSSRPPSGLSKLHRIRLQLIQRLCAEWKTVQCQKVTVSCEFSKVSHR